LRIAAPRELAPSERRAALAPPALHEQIRIGEAGKALADALYSETS
jgi:hypothetical protein